MRATKPKATIAGIAGLAEEVGWSGRRGDLAVGAIDKMSPEKHGERRHF